MKYIIIFFLLISCGQQDEPQTFIIQGQELQCTVIETTPCGLTVACENDAGIHQCVSN